nr:putative ribonuclease H-like domain-containing protein [Tanacetum cinerariifolium]
MDVKSAFLYGTIDEEVYVMQPPRFQDPEIPAKVYKVEKAMYGLHQAPRAWYGTLSNYLLTNGFQRIDIQMARQLEEEMERDAQRMNEQIARDAKIARIHAEEELQIMIDGSDRSNETVAKYL